MNVRLNAEGFDVELGSIESLISGGVTFGVQRNSDDGRRVTEDMRSFHCLILKERCAKACMMIILSLLCYLMNQ